eukprot:135431_1
MTAPTYCINKETIVNNCLMVCIGISKYKTGIPDIPDIKHDIDQYKKTFKDNYNYKVMCNDYDDVLYTNNMFEHFLCDLSLQHLCNANDGGILYNGLLITISGHCNENALLCSDGKLISFNKILSIFTNNWNHQSVSSNLPKFIIVDGCRGFDINAAISDRNKIIITDEEKQLCAENMYCSILCSNSSIHCGQISWNFCQIFENKKNENDLMFYEIIMNLRYRL